MNLQPQDLRLGILIHDTVRNINTTLQLKHFRELSISEKAFFNRYKLVEITEPMLLELGFEYLPEAEYDMDTLQMNGFRIWYQSRKKFVIELFKADSKDIQYAHQIQNLYQSLTNSELNVDNFLLRNPN